MRWLISLRGFSLLLAAAFCFAGCNTPTVFNFSGTPGTKFHGQYRSWSASYELRGATPMTYKAASLHVSEIEFQKENPEGELVIELAEPQSQPARFTAGPGTRGVKAKRDAFDWQRQNF
jgi:hypothetical protein